MSGSWVRALASENEGRLQDDLYGTPTSSSLPSKVQTSRRGTFKVFQAHPRTNAPDIKKSRFPVSVRFQQTILGPTSESDDDARLGVGPILDPST